MLIHWVPFGLYKPLRVSSYHFGQYQQFSYDIIISHASEDDIMFTCTLSGYTRAEKVKPRFLDFKSTSLFIWVFGWLKQSLSQSIGSFSCNPHFALFLPGQRSDIFWNVSNHCRMVTYNFFRNIFLGSLIRAQSGAEFVVLQMCIQALLPYI